MKTTLFTAVLTLCAFSGLSAFAHEGHDHGGACKADMEKFCKDVKPGEGRIIECLKTHEADLSKECKEHGDKMKAHMKKEMEELNEDCKAEIAANCKDVKPGHGAVVKCLADHKSDKYSAKCSEELKEHQDKWKEHHDEKMEKMGKMDKKMDKAADKKAE